MSGHIGGTTRETCTDPLNCPLCYPNSRDPLPRQERPPTTPGITCAQTVAGTLSRIYVDRDHVKQAGATARPWIVDNERGKFRCREIRGLCEADTVFKPFLKPALWLETTQVVPMWDVEVLSC